MRVRTLGRAVAASAVFAAVALTPTVASGSVLPIPDVDVAVGPDARQSTDYRAAQDTASPAPTPEPAPSPEPRIVGGEATTTDRFPWMVALVTSADSPYCGGALIAPDRVLTAAHCVSGKSTSSLRVVAGRTDMRTDDGVTTRVRQVWTHPGYRSPLGGDDVAVLTLDRAPGYRTIPLETDPGAYPPGRMSTVLGWGYTAEQGPVSPVLRSVDVPLVADRDCDATYPDFDARTMVCAGERGGGRDACSGDSGGPLIADGRLIGVVSWGSGCARPNLPGVYVRVTAYTAAVREQLR